ncbi:chaperone protein dnaJ A6, chloroplastic-like isoform X1 [Papaver somniferum]|uniref:chaperone protein dnaJ A6, chloroplastic-like isoform X1 n=1 Tax=Papaver somniferum TaxID=3469 RepID=UPI000E6F832A|nr:chaperone protein dnaJ A6, chloroplastic-like isoform X1 [Papaver somniferum]
MIRKFMGGGILEKSGHCIRPSSSSSSSSANQKTTQRCLRFPTRCLPFSDEFSLLGLTPYASKADVKHAYKRLALKYHPDVIKAGENNEKQETFKEIKSAYEVKEPILKMKNPKLKTTRPLWIDLRWKRSPRRRRIMTSLMNGMNGWDLREGFQ